MYYCALFSVGSRVVFIEGEWVKWVIRMLMEVIFWIPKLDWRV